jgi:hypothetical protein
VGCIPLKSLLMCQMNLGWHVDRGPLQCTARSALPDIYRRRRRSLLSGSGDFGIRSLRPIHHAAGYVFDKHSAGSADLTLWRPMLLIIWPPADSNSRRHIALRYASVVLTPDDQSITQCEPAECEISGLSAADRLGDADHGILSGRSGGVFSQTFTGLCSASDLKPASRIF